MNDPLPPHCQHLILQYAVNEDTYQKLWCVCKSWYKWTDEILLYRSLAKVYDLCKNKPIAKKFVVIHASAPLEAILEYRN